MWESCHLSHPRFSGELPLEGEKTPFRFAVCNETFGDWPHEKVCDFVVECGYQGLEIAPFTFANDVREISALRRSEIRRQAETAGLEIVGLHWLLSRTQGLHLTSPEPEVRKKTSDYLEELRGTVRTWGAMCWSSGHPSSGTCERESPRNKGCSSRPRSSVG